MAQQLDDGNQRWQRMANIVARLGSEVAQDYLEKFFKEKGTTLEAEVQNERTTWGSKLKNETKNLFNSDGTMKNEFDITYLSRIAFNLSLSSSSAKNMPSISTVC